VSPLLAARAEKRKVTLAEVAARARQLQKRFPVLIVEGAGGLLSPLGEDFDSRDLIKTLRATPVIVAANRLGVINRVLLTVEALPRAIAQRARFVLVKQLQPDSASRGNLKFLRDKFGSARVHELPRINFPESGRASATLKTLTRSLL